MNWKFLFLISMISVSTFAKAKPGKVIGSKQVYETYLNMYSAGKLPQHDIVCIPAKKRYCTADSCINVDSKVFNLVNRSGKGVELSRCDSQGCNTYPAQSQQSGVFLNVQPNEPKGLSMKINFIEDNLTYIETTSQLLDVYMSYGQCKELAVDQTKK